MLHSLGFLFLVVVDLSYYILYAEKGDLFLMSWTGRGAAVFFFVRMESRRSQDRYEAV